MRVCQLRRYPVKSLQGTDVDAVAVGPTGVVGDRAWGVRDEATGAVLSAKREPRLLLATADALGEGVRITIPGQAPSNGTAADEQLSQWLARTVRLDIATEAPYVDEAHLHLLTVDELGGWDVRRFRPNVVVAGIASLDDLVGARLQLGKTVVVEIAKRTKRCAMPTMAQPGFGRDVDVLRSLAKTRELKLGVYARVVTPGPLTVDAPITVG